MKVGDYVRTKGKTFQPPQIAKIRSMKKDSGYKNQYLIELDHNLLCEFEFEVYEEDIDKSSPNIIDLIEVGDYIDKLRVVDKDENYIVVETFDERIVITKEDTIKSIVTKEMYSSVEYRVESH